jgi:hypothetical protein
MEKAKRQIKYWAKKMQQAEATGDINGINKATEKIIYWEQVYDSYLD